VGSLLHPVNEPLISAVFSAERGWWNEQATDDRTFVAAIDGATTCAVAASEAIRGRRPEAIFLQSDTCEAWEPADDADDAAVELAEFRNQRRFVAWALAYGRRPGPLVVDWLRSNGIGEDRLGWFEEHGSSEGSIVGHDYYTGNERVVGSGGTVRAKSLDEERGYAAVARDYHDHFGLPFMLSETNMAGEAAPAWLARTWNDALELRRQGLPIRGYTWYGFIDHVDWDSQLREDAGRQNTCGLVGLDRRPHPSGLIYRGLAQRALADELRPLDDQAGATDAARPGG
jgi:hypothetical protein